jgi:hypothetical protein
MDLQRIIHAALMCVAALIAVGTTAPLHAQETNAQTAFINFVRTENYRDADFYIESKFVDPKTLDTSQIFYSVLKEEYWPDVPKNMQKIDVLYNYLAQIGPIDLNRVMDCETNRRCLLVFDVLSGQPPATVKYFVDRGLDLNRSERGFVPTTVPMLVRLGSGYRVEDMNALVAMGLVLGDEVYPIEDLSNYNDGYLNNGNRLQMPDNYLELNDQNLLDMAVIALGSQVGGDSPRQSLRRKTLCEFITYAAPSFQPSFDYLFYLLKVSDTFRGKYVGKTEKYGSNVFQPFPNSCVSLIQSMAASHNQLQTVMSDFANRGDVETAQWLISIQRNGQ